MDLPDRVYSLGMDLAGLLHPIAIDDVGLIQSRVLFECLQ